jgi:hypothetical protein
MSRTGVTCGTDSLSAPSSPDPDRGCLRVHHARHASVCPLCSPALVEAEAPSRQDQLYHLADQRTRKAHVAVNFHMTIEKAQLHPLRHTAQGEDRILRQCSRVLLACLSASSALSFTTACLPNLMYYRKECLHTMTGVGFKWLKAQLLRLTSVGAPKRASNAAWTAWTPRARQHLAKVFASSPRMPLCVICALLHHGMPLWRLDEPREDTGHCTSRKEHPPHASLVVACDILAACDADIPLLWAER